MNRKSARYRVAWVNGVPVIRDTMNGMWTQPFFNRRPGGVMGNATLCERRADLLNIGLFNPSDSLWYSDGKWSYLHTEAVGHV